MTTCSPGWPGRWTARSWRQADRFGPKAARLAAREQVNELVGEWVGSLPCDEVLARCRQAEVPAGQLYSVADIFHDPQYAHRENIVTQGFKDRSAGGARGVAGAV